MNFEINFAFLIKPLFLHDQSQEKNLNIIRTEKAFEVKEKTFFIIIKGLSLKQIKNFFGSLTLTLSLVTKAYHLA